MKRILIDGRFIGVGESMTRYCLEIVKGILELDKENEYTLLVRPQGKKLTADSPKGTPISRGLQLTAKNFRTEILDIPHYSIAEQTKLLKYLNEERYDLVHFIQFNHPVRYKGKFVVTIHDLTLLGHLHREKFYKRLAFGRVMRSAVKNSAKIITISETSKKEIIEYYGVDPNKIEVTYLAVDSAYNAEVKNQESRIKQFKEKYGITGDYILYTGMWKKHKNLIRLLRAYEIFVQNRCKSTDIDIVENTAKNNGTMGQLSNGTPQLVLVGKIDKEESEVIREIDRINSAIFNFQFSIFNKITNYKSQKEVIASYQFEGEAKQSENGPLTSESPAQGSLRDCKLKAIITTGYIDEAELPFAYSGALAYVIPSLSEGFGLPPLEAMACGTPVLSSNISAMPEILGSAPLYFDPYDIDDMAEKIKMMADDENLRAEKSKFGLDQVKKYSWQQTANKTLEIYKSCLDQ